MKLELRGIGKRFGPVIANDNIDLVVEPGEIHVLLGENGAGKSTLMNVLYGLYKPDSGQILLDGEPVVFAGPGDAVDRGVGMVHQHFMLIPVFTVAESVALGHEPMKGAGLIDFQQARQTVLDVSNRFGFSLDPDALIEDLPVGAQQQVEIVKALSRDAKVLILDEPTSVLTPQETDELMAIMRQLADDGTSIIFITHKLREVRAVADRITIIRRGKVVGTAEPSTSEADLAAAMVGRPVDLKGVRSAIEPGDVVLEIDNLSVLNETGQLVVDHASMNVRASEIVGIAGVQGNGQTELAQVLLGVENAEGGRIRLHGKDITNMSVRSHIDGGVRFIPEDRTVDGMVKEMSVAENLILNTYRHFADRKTISPEKLNAHANATVETYDVRLGSVTDPMGTLSGGNQQKVVVARELGNDITLLVANQPTRGVDVGSIEFIHAQLVAQRDAGKPIVLISSELDEILKLSDRIVVMYRGRIVGEVGPDTDRDILGLMMAGVPLDEAIEAVEGNGGKRD
ncbi:ABC transporter ATP-binding protein [Stomatohabitans albus]|uniref:ABC transporter ATP-binding protein n=1 Tax=Stomatohabitans albus TaxID=3110766 RepID=UPI00300C6921